MTGQLASLLRSSLDGAADPLVSLREELGNVRNYLEIEHVRFGQRLRYDICAAGELHDLQVPRLALQTLVENAVKFAVSPRREGGQVSLSAVATTDGARLTVKDDGPGFDPSAAPDHHGLALLRDRLRLTYGDRASLFIESRPGATQVTMVLPR
jgi:sensor histidine kinase YesM